MSSKNVNQTLPSETTNNDNSLLKEKIRKINEAIQEMGEKELQYEDGHDL